MRLLWVCIWILAARRTRQRPQGLGGQRLQSRAARRPAKRRLKQVRYVSGLVSLDQIGGQLRHDCRQVGVPRADVVVGLTDGG